MVWGWAGVLESLLGAGVPVLIFAFTNARKARDRSDHMNERLARIEGWMTGVIARLENLEHRPRDRR